MKKIIVILAVLLFVSAGPVLAQSATATMSPQSATTQAQSAKMLAPFVFKGSLDLSSLHTDIKEVYVQCSLYKNKIDGSQVNYTSSTGRGKSKIFKVSQDGTVKGTFVVNAFVDKDEELDDVTGFGCEVNLTDGVMRRYVKKWYDPKKGTKQIIDYIGTFNPTTKKVYEK